MNITNTSSVPSSDVWPLGDPTVDPVLPERTWYGMLGDQARAARDRADSGDTAADRINREAGCEPRQEDRRDPASEGDGNGGI
jgi:hypothetical protein